MMKPEHDRIGRDRTRLERAFVVSGFATVVLINGCDGDHSHRSPPAPMTTMQGVPPAPWFEEVARARGIEFVWRSGHADRHMLPEITGGGAAMFDFDNDGDLDLYFVQAGSLTQPQSNTPNRLFRNRGDGTFEEVSHAGGADDRGYGMGVACGDFDNDGFVDLYVTNVGPNVLYRNNGDGTFANVTAHTGVGHGGWASSVAFLDYNRDGWLDLFVCNYIHWSSANELTCYNTLGGVDYCAPSNYNAPAMDVLYRNNGDGTFSDATIEAGLDFFYGTGLGVVAADFNRDGWIDIFVANDGMRNQLWFNRRDGTFVDLALQLGCGVDEEGKTKAGMGVDVSDVDDDGDFDVLVCNLRRESNSLFINEGSYFTDATARAGLRASTRGFTGFGIGWIDFNNDGRLDVYQAHGLVTHDEARLMLDDPYAQANLVFAAGAAGRFHEVTPRGGTPNLLTDTSRAAAFGDIDNDGGVDVLVINRDAPAYLLRNVVPQRGRWIQLRVMEHGRDAYGATVTAKCPERTVTRTVHATFSFMASNDPRIHIGLGAADRVESVRVQWSDGTSEMFGPFEADRMHTLIRGGGTE